MSTWLVTGGAGFIGSNFVRAALETPVARIVVLDKLTYAGRLQNLAPIAEDPRYSFVRADIADRTEVAAVFREYQPTAVVNFAAESHVDRSIDGPTAFVTTNIVGTFELLEASRELLSQSNEAARRDFRFLHVSTDEVYGSLGPTGAFEETTPYQPNSVYSASKASADHLVRAYQQTFGIPSIITNCSNNFGPYQLPEKLIPLMILNAIEGKPLPIYGDGGNIRDWLYVEDHCEGILQVLERGQPGEKYNIGGGNERTNLEIIDALCEELEAALPAPDNPALKSAGAARYADLKQFVSDRPGHDRRYAINAEKIQRELGWQAKIGFEAGIRETVRWYLENRDWCESVEADGSQRERRGTL
ncbi:MAG: dTDP-glucose 4,6-dehydratase [Deltaproteobacteria bacterium]|nr:dTDP-glucose 4,6-dehydratase [Deltaproteobacteria bacterium]